MRKCGIVLLTLLLAVVMSQISFTATDQMVVQKVNQMPLAFTKNMGQWDDRVLFRASAGGATMWFTKDGVTYQFTRRISSGNPDDRRGTLHVPAGTRSGVGQNRFGFDSVVAQDRFGPDNSGLAGAAPNDPIPLLRGVRGVSDRDSIEQLVLTAKFIGANPNPEVSAEGQMEYKCNYFLGNDPSKWHTDVPNYEAITLKEIYPGIDLKYSGDGSGQATYEFIVTNDADGASQGEDTPLFRGVRGVSLSQIKVAYEGADETSLDANGRLILRTKWGEMIAAINSPRPLGEGSGVRAVLSGTASFSQLSEKTIGLEATGASRQALGANAVELLYSTYLGGGTTDQGFGIAVDGSGCAYVTGYTSSSNFPTQNAYDASINGSGLEDAFLTKFTPEGSSLIYSTYFGGYSDDRSSAVALDDLGCAYVTGFTASPDFPTQNAYDASHNGIVVDAFVTKFSIAGNSLVYSTFLGGTGDDFGKSIAVDDHGCAYVTGFTYSLIFPTYLAYQSVNAGGTDAFVTKFSAEGNTLGYSTYLGGNVTDEGYGIAVDDSGCAYVTGITYSYLFPTLHAFDAYRSGSTDAFVSKFSATGSSLVYSTYLGGSSDEGGSGIAVDALGCAYITGHTTSLDFPTQNAYDASFNGNNDVFVTKLSEPGGTLIYSTYLGGSPYDYGWSIAVDRFGCAYVTGETHNPGLMTAFPTQNAYDASFNGISDVFVTELSAAGSSLVYSTYLGGSGYDGGSSIAVNGLGIVCVTGKTLSSDFPTLNAFDVSSNYSEAFVTRVGHSHDVGGLYILAPADSVPLGGTVTPRAVVRNIGANPETFPVVYRVSSLYADTVEVGPVPPSDTAVIDFEGWKATTVGSFVPSCFTDLSTDEYREDDTAYGYFIVRAGLAPEIYSLTPNCGGNTGSVLVTIVGDKFQGGANVRLESGGTVIVPEEAIIVNVLSANTIRAIVNLQEAPPGLCDLVVRNPDEGVGVFYDAFTAETGREDLWTVITGPDVVRAGRSGTFLIQYGNAGNDDAWSSSLLLTIPPRVTYEILMDDGSTLTGMINIGDNITHYAMVAIPYLPPGGTGTVRLRLFHDEVISTYASFRAGLYANLNQFWEPRITVYDTATSSLLSTTRSSAVGEEILPGVAGASTIDSKGGGGCTPADIAGPTAGTLHNLHDDEWQEMTMSLGDGTVGLIGLGTGADGNPIRRLPLPINGQQEDGGGIEPWPGMTPKEQEIIRNVFSTWENLGADIITFNPDMRTCKSCGYSSAVQDKPCCLSCVGLAIRVLNEAAIISCQQDKSPGACSWAKEERSNPAVYNEDLMDRALKLHGLTQCPKGDMDQCMRDCMVADSGSGSLGIGGAAMGYGVGGSMDPNGKAGPAGFGEAGFIRSDLPMTYLVHFENDSSATLFSDTVWVADTLSPNLDWNTLEFGTIYPGDGPNSIRPNFNAVTSFDPITGVATWALCDINLPPDTMPYWGEGWVSYTVKPKPNLPTGTRIENIAAIKFDVNDWILAPMDSVPVFNIIDAGTPSSSVTSLPDTSFGLRLDISWSGTDEAGGSGIAGYTIYHRVDSGPFIPWIIDTISTHAVFLGEDHHSYSFYSVARDNVGHVEFMPVTSDAMTYIDFRALCGDCDADGLVRVSDIVFLVEYIFAAGSAPRDPSGGDVDCDSKTSLTDAVYLVNYVFVGGPPPCSACK